MVLRFEFQHRPPPPLEDPTGIRGGRRGVLVMVKPHSWINYCILDVIPDDLEDNGFIGLAGFIDLIIGPINAIRSFFVHECNLLRILVNNWRNKDYLVSMKHIK
jgi:hypothetical protein